MHELRIEIALCVLYAASYDVAPMLDKEEEIGYVVCKESIEKR